MTNNDIIEKILQDEGVLSNDLYDKGGVTKYGIILQDIKEYYNNNNLKEEDIINLTIEQAKEIYLNKYIIKQGYDNIKNDFIRYSIIDFGVNCGNKKANEKMQKIINIIEKRNILEEDGIFGSKTLQYINNNSTLELFIKYNNERIKYYADIVKNNTTQTKFIVGWVTRTIRIINNNYNFF